MQIVSRPSDANQQDSRTARAASGFGCIRCGCTIYQYCTVEAPGGSAGESGGGAFLLCPPCKDMLNGFAERVSVLEVLRRSPVPAQRGFYRDLLPYMRGYEIPDFRIGGVSMRQTPVPVMLGGKPVLNVGPPENYAGPVQLTVMLGGADGVPVMVIRQNEWIAPAGEWLFERRGNRYAVRSRDGAAELVLSCAPDKVLTIETLRSRIGARSLVVEAGTVRLNGEPVRLAAADRRIIGVTL
jgi:hypothetical protein